MNLSVFEIICERAYVAIAVGKYNKEVWSRIPLFRETLFMLHEFSLDPMLCYPGYQSQKIIKRKK